MIKRDLASVLRARGAARVARACLMVCGLLAEGGENSVVLSSCEGEGSIQMREARFGEALASIEDVTGDGLPDVVVGAPNATPDGMDGAGAAFVISGMTGSVHHVIAGETAGEACGTAVAPVRRGAGRVVAAIVVAAPDFAAKGVRAAGIIRVVDTKSWESVWTRTGSVQHERLGLSVIAAEGSDGSIQCMTTSLGTRRDEGCGGVGAVRSVVFGTEKQRLWSLFPAKGVDWRFVSLVEVSGVGGDGRVVVVAPVAGSAYLFKGTEGDGVPIAANMSVGGLGGGVSTVGDVNGDGLEDVGVGCPRKRIVTSGKVVEAGQVTILSGKDLSSLATWHGVHESEFGSALAGCGDMDGDGSPEVAVGASCWSTGGSILNGVVQIVTARSGRVVRELVGSRFSRFGSSIATADFNGDGVRDLVIGAPFAEKDREGTYGSVEMISGKDWGVAWRVSGWSMKRKGQK